MSLNSTQPLMLNERVIHKDLMVKAWTMCIQTHVETCVRHRWCLVESDGNDVYSDTVNVVVGRGVRSMQTCTANVWVCKKGLMLQNSMLCERGKITLSWTDQTSQLYVLSYILFMLFIFYYLSFDRARVCYVILQKKETFFFPSGETELFQHTCVWGETESF